MEYLDANWVLTLGLYHGVGVLTVLANTNPKYVTVACLGGACAMQ